MTLRKLGLLLMPFAIPALVMGILCLLVWHGKYHAGVSVFAVWTDWVIVVLAAALLFLTGNNIRRALQARTLFRTFFEAASAQQAIRTGEEIASHFDSIYARSAHDSMGSSLLRVFNQQPPKDTPDWLTLSLISERNQLYYDEYLRALSRQRRSLAPERRIFLRMLLGELLPTMRDDDRRVGEQFLRELQ